MMQNQIISAKFNDFNVSFSNDAYINATEIAKQFGKLPKDFLKSDQTKEYIKGLASYLTTRRNILVKENQLVIVRNGGNNRGTWLHPKLAIFFARWLSVDFALWCDEQIEKMLHPALEQQTITTQQQHEIKEAVHQNVSRTGRTFQAVYHDLYLKFQIPKYQDLLARDFEAAIKYLGCSDKPAIPLFANMTTNGRWLVVVNNNMVTHVKNLADYNCVNAKVVRNLIMQTKQQSEYLLELAKRLRVVEGECLESRLDTPIEELHPRFII